MRWSTLSESAERQIRQDDSTDPLAEDIVMGGSMGEMGPFSKAISFDTPQAKAGAIILKTLSAKMKQTGRPASSG